MVYGADMKIIPAWTIALIVLARMSKDQGLIFLIGAVNHTREINMAKIFSRSGDCLTLLKSDCHG